MYLLEKCSIQPARVVLINKEDMEVIDDVPFMLSLKVKPSEYQTDLEGVTHTFHLV